MTLFDNLISGIARLLSSAGFVVFAYKALEYAAKERYSAMVALGVSAVVFALFAFGGVSLFEALGCAAKGLLKLPC